MSNAGITRRSFIKGSIAAGAVMAAPFSRVLGANDGIRVAVAGFNQQGAGHINEFRRIRGVRVVALCDPDRHILDREAAKFTRVDKYIDVRKVLDDKNIDAIVVATPNHWHSLITVWACQAGKDVYVEKPVSHNMWEGGQMVQAARKYKRMVQVGTHRRSDAGIKKAVQYIQQGNLGKIQWIHAIWCSHRESIGKVSGPVQVPSHIDYNLWTGPAPLKPLMRKNLHYDWHWDWSTGNGDAGNCGIHVADVARWIMDKNELPRSVMSFGGRLGFGDDDGQTPNTQVSIFDFGSAPVILENRNLKQDRRNLRHYKGISIGDMVKCEHGYYVGDDGGGVVYDNDGKKINKISGHGGEGHRQNFIRAVRSRNAGDLNAEILDGHLSTNMCHMANISYRLGQQCSNEKIKESIKINDEALTTLELINKHLESHNVNVKETPMTLGPWLKWDAAKEKFTGDFPAKWANMLLKDNYRKPFVVPENV